MFVAIADPTRRRLLDLLGADPGQPVHSLAKPFAMTRPAISQHLRILRHAGLVRAEQVGRQRVYALNPRPLRDVFEWASLYRGLFKDSAGHAWRVHK